MFELTVWISGLGMLWIPGFILARLLRLRIPDPLASLAAQFSLGLAFWPLCLLWTTVLGVRLTPMIARAGLGVLLAATVVLLARERWHRPNPSRVIWVTLIALVFAVTVATRWAHIRELAAPAWVDSVHHTAIIRLITAQGRLPLTYEPLIPHGAPFYHWGYHALVSWLLWILGQSDAFVIADVMLQFGQLLNALVVILAYAAGRVLFSSRRAGAFAATLAAVVSYFPAYFVSWGRYTHLVGALLLLGFFLALWKTKPPPLDARGWRGRTPAVLFLAFVAAGLVLVHVRMAFFALTLAIALGIFLAIRRQWRVIATWTAAALIAVIITSPWLINLARIEQVRGIVAPGESLTDFRTPADIRADHLWPPRNREMLALASAGITGLLGWPPLSVGKRVMAIAFWIAVIACAEWQHRRRRRFPLPPWRGLAILAVWVVLTAIFMNLDTVGLPTFQFASNTSGVISLFIPLSLAAGGILAWVSGIALPRRWTSIGTALIVLVIAAVSGAGMRNIVNPRTVLITHADREALKWIRTNVPAHARFAVRAQPWLGNSFVGIDGGYWIPVLTDRQSMLPPAIYKWSSPPAEVQRIENALSAFARADAMDDQDLHAFLRSERISHIYFGANPGTLTPERFAFTKLTRQIYSRNGVTILQVQP